MTKDEYLKLKADYEVAKDKGRIFNEICGMARQLDEHVKEVTVNNAQNWLIENLGKNDGIFFGLLIGSHFGSVETDEFCQRHKFYPDYA